MFDKETWEKIQELQEKWQTVIDHRYQGKSYTSTSRSGVSTKAVYSGADMAADDYNDIGMPGQYPYTRGIYPIHYQHQPWMDLQIIGFGNAHMLRERMDLLKEQGGAKSYFGGEAYNVIFDVAGSDGHDPDDPLVLGRIGDVGLQVCKAGDFEILLKDKDLTQTHFSVVGNHCLFPLYLTAAERMGFDIKDLSGNTVAYLWDHFACFGVNYEPRNSFKVIRELIRFCRDNVPKWNTVTISEHNMGEAGATAAQSVGICMSVIIAINESCQSGGLDLDDCVPGYGFHVRYGEDFFEDIAKTRALRRMYAKLNKERFGCKKPASMQAKIHAQTAGSCMTVQQPKNNLIRAAVGTMSAVLSGVNGMTVNAYDEALGEPTDESVTLAIRTSQILASETGLTRVSDPLGGSYYLERLTNDLEAEANKFLAEIEKRGGYIACIENGWIKQQVQQKADEWRREVDSGERVVVGVNEYVTKEEIRENVFEPDPAAETWAINDLERHRRERDNEKTQTALNLLKQEAEKVVSTDKVCNLIEKMLDAARADATLGEIQSVLFKTFGQHH